MKPVKDLTNHYWITHHGLKYQRKFLILRVFNLIIIKQINILTFILDIQVYLDSKFKQIYFR